MIASYISLLVLLASAIATPVSPAAKSSLYKRDSAKALDLGSACAFVIAAGAALTVGATVKFTGPTANVQSGAAITGYTSPSGDGVLTSEVSNAVATAIAAAYAQSGATSFPAAGDVSPGVYTSVAAGAIPANWNLVGDANSVFIFHSDAAINFAASTKMTSSGGVVPSNVFFVGKGAITVGASSDIFGFLISTAAVTLGASVILSGNIYSQQATTLGASCIITTLVCGQSKAADNTCVASGYVLKKSLQNCICQCT